MRDSAEAVAILTSRLPPPPPAAAFLPPAAFAGVLAAPFAGALPPLAGALPPPFAGVLAIDQFPRTFGDAGLAAVFQNLKSDARCLAVLRIGEREIRQMDRRFLR